MQGVKHETHEPFIRIAKRNKTTTGRGIAVRAAAIVVASILTLIFINLVGEFSFADTAKNMWNGAFQNGIKIETFFKDTCMLLLFAIALAPAFKMRLWNIGAQGQVLMGGLIAAMILYYFGNKLPQAVIVPLMILGAMLAGLIWAALPALFRVQFSTNETLFTLMMNYVAIQIVSCFADIWKGKKSSLGIIDRKAGYIPKLFGSKYGWIFLITVLFAIFMYVYMSKTKHGYEIAVVGESVNTARYAGINNKIVIVRTIALSGAIAGLIGYLYVACLNHTISAGTGGAYGFTAIIVAWLANFNSVFMALISLLLAFLSSGSAELVNNNPNLNSAVSDIVISIFLFCILGCEFFIRYRLIFNFGKNKAKEETK